jgi:hypothetical protein
VTITLTEPLAAASVNGGNFRVIASDDSQSAPMTISAETTSDGQYRVHLVPVGLLKSNLTYTIAISDSITDPSGNKMTFAVTTNFTTVDYTEPRVIATTPATSQAVGDGTTFYLRFNKPLDGSIFAAGGSGTLRLEQLSGNHETVVGSPPPISAFVDSTSASTLVVAPVGVSLQPAAFYRITIDGARDTLTPPNIQATAQIFDFFSADHASDVKGRLGIAYLSTRRSIAFSTSQIGCALSTFNPPQKNSRPSTSLKNSIPLAPPESPSANEPPR